MVETALKNRIFSHTRHTPETDQGEDIMQMNSQINNREQTTVSFFFKKFLQYTLDMKR